MAVKLRKCVTFELRDAKNVVCPLIPPECSFDLSGVDKVS